MRLKKIERFRQKNANVAIKRVKSNALALALSSDSNIDEVNNIKDAKVLKKYRSNLNVGFLEVTVIYQHNFDSISSQS